MAASDLHLTFNYPCRGSGNNAAPGIPDTDFEMDPRVACGTVDMGADGIHTHLYWTGDAAPGGIVALKFVGLPWTASVLLWLGSGVLDPPWPTKYGNGYLQPPLIAKACLVSIPSPDGVLVLTFTLPAMMPGPLTLFFQAGIGTALTNLSVMEVE